MLNVYCLSVCLCVCGFLQSYSCSNVQPLGGDYPGAVEGAVVAVQLD